MLIMELDVFKFAHQLVLDIYEITKIFPRHELWNLVSQMRKAACSIPTNLMEGASRRSDKEFKYFISISCGSCSELEYQVYLSCDLSYISQEKYEELSTNIQRVKQMLFGLIKNLNQK